jgi:A/G-specific adenine glycosylase
MSEPTTLLADAAIEWYDRNARDLPWREPGVGAWEVLVSEVMLQQTQVTRVVPAFRNFLRRYPSVRSLAAAPLREVLGAWAGLGYNRRAVNLSSAARTIVRSHGGRVPSSPEFLRTLPGVGPYTAAALASLAFGLPVPAIDTNVARVVARARLGGEPREVRRGDLEAAARDWLDPTDPGAWNQALMDLGREVCRPAPRCSECPLSRGCRFHAAGLRVARTGRPRAPFRGSIREVRGAVIRELRDRPSASVAALARLTGEPASRVIEAIRALARDGLVEASAAAIEGRPRGRVRLPRD